MATVDEPDAERVRLNVTAIDKFAAVDEETAKPLIGDEETCLLSLGGMMVMYGDGGAGKTTLELDFLMHLAAGEPWLELPVDTEQRILIIENEGPRGMFRKKIRRKLDKWELREVNGNISVLEDPWALFSFGIDVFREQLRMIVDLHEFDIVAAGPVNSLGMVGAGTPEDISAFVYHVNDVRNRCARPVAALFVHHENKSGDVSGAWEGVPDTLAHVSNKGNGRTLLHWQKVRWGPRLHGTTWNLGWTEGESFEREEKEVRSDSDMEADMLAFIDEHPGCSWRDVRDAVEGQVQRLTQLRDRLLESGGLENKGRGNSMRLHIGGGQGDPASPSFDVNENGDLEWR